ncbi:hypothetical protein [Mycoplasma feriruminatoris]|uniref:Acetyltransferase n=1 Tax=Mycoplasma feriruminatoris TaxID=1179777 RepID=A0AAQ3DM66_9MOLU|nr:hypothetical protein [Mycoplasma feriruminatoris]UKS54270.1 hypothetical protein D500_00625 [Mycoplasma feriruminatoris]WFQ90323.1 hypothetical protein MFERI11561_00576 [Mycoplasma feriruminatoris]WFQ91969.1 hypothetical protein MFERI14815_00584 [Mycoplasma feriruminatoris]WFQ92809.1 hypothetical protein MFERI14822_00600 [Mycoplasma feriruminatoris]WFQ93654.1 acetyltransferase [Mycoplasma feriruminatoris]
MNKKVDKNINNKSKEKKPFWSKLMFWKSDKDLIQQNYFENILYPFFITKENEKKNVLDLIKKQDIQYFLFYTNSKNWLNILQYGICPAKHIKLKANEKYYVWSYQQKDYSIGLEFDASSRAQFWKWIKDTDVKSEEFLTIAINPNTLYTRTKKDWVFDKSLSMVFINEAIQIECIEWILFRDYELYKKAEEYLRKTLLNDSIRIYYKNDSKVEQIESNNDNEKATR